MFPNTSDLSAHVSFPTFSDCSQHVHISKHFQIFPQHVQMFPNIFRFSPTPSDFSHPIRVLPNTFRIYPTPSDFTHILQILPTPLSLLGPKKLTLGPVDLFGPNNRPVSSFLDFGEVEFENDPGKLNSNKHPTSWC